MRVSAVGTYQDRHHFLERTDSELRECPEPSHKPSLRMALGSLVLRVSLVTCTSFMVRSPPAFFADYEDNDNADNNNPRPPYRFGCPFHLNQNTLGSYQSLDARLVISGARQRGRCRETRNSSPSDWVRVGPSLARIGSVTWCTDRRGPAPPLTAATIEITDPAGMGVASPPVYRISSFPTKTLICCRISPCSVAMRSRMPG